MFNRYIIADVKMRLWLASGGRCEYPNCNQVLWKDEITQRMLNRSYIAHIEAVSKNGARYNDKLNKKNLNSFSNLMLLCDTHHRMIDNVNEEGIEPHIHHRAELLKKYKKEHEERIEFMSSLSSSRGSYPMVLKSNLEKYKVNFDLDDIREAMLPDRRPKTLQTIDIDLTKSSLTEKDDRFWEQNAFEIKMQLDAKIQQAPDGNEINHLSIFAMGPIPLIIYFGFCLGDIIDMNSYQKHRNAGWKWEGNNDKSNANYESIFPENIGNSSEAVLELSISGNITDTQYPEQLKSIPKFTFKAEHPSLFFLDAFEKLELFRKEIREFMKYIREEYPQITKLHMLAAVPCPIAIEFGRAYIKEDPKILIYNSSREERIFKFALEIK